jgi:hypothetical protein
MVNKNHTSNRKMQLLFLTDKQRVLCVAGTECLEYLNVTVKIRIILDELLLVPKSPFHKVSTHFIYQRSIISRTNRSQKRALNVLKTEHVCSPAKMLFL